MRAGTRTRPSSTSLVAIVAFLTAISIQAAVVFVVHDGRLTGPFLVGEQVAPYFTFPVDTQVDSVGYDGQFFLALALSPTLDEPGLIGVFDEPAYRARRILWPLLSHVTGLGRPDAVVLALYLWLSIAVAAGAWAISWWTTRSGRSPWWGMLYVANLGVIVCLWRMLGDVVMTSLLLTFLVAVRHGVPDRGSILLAGAILAKETALLGALALLLVAAWTRKWSLAVWALLSMAPALLWWIYASWQLGDVGDSLVRENFVLLPATGLVASAAQWVVSERDWWAIGKDLVLAAIYLAPLVALCSLVVNRRRSERIALRAVSHAVLTLLAGAFCLLPLFLGPAVWEELWAFSRALLPISPLAFLWALAQRRTISSVLAAAPFGLLAVAGVFFTLRLTLGQTP